MCEYVNKVEAFLKEEESPLEDRHNIPSCHLRLGSGRPRQQAPPIEAQLAESPPLSGAVWPEPDALPSQQLPGSQPPGFESGLGGRKWLQS